jgi:hypothetical protein
MSDNEDDGTHQPDSRVPHSETVALGREPDVRMIVQSPVPAQIDAADKKNLLGYTAEGEIDDLGGHEERPEWVTVPDRCKTMLLLLAWFIVATVAVVTIVAFGQNPYCYDENDATLTRRMQMHSWMDASADPCTDFYG